MMDVKICRCSIPNHEPGCQQYFPIWHDPRAAVSDIQFAIDELQKKLDRLRHRLEVERHLYEMGGVDPDPYREDHW